MINYLLRRILLLIPTLFGITIVTFVVMQFAPGEPAVLQQAEESGIVGTSGEAARNLEKFREMYHLDEPIYVQYGYWIKRLVVLDFGESLIDHRPVLAKINARIWNTLQINIIAFVLAWLIAVPLGIFSAVYRRSLMDNVSTVVVFVLYSMPTFWTALLLIILFRQ